MMSFQIKHFKWPRNGIYSSLGRIRSVFVDHNGCLYSLCFHRQKSIPKITKQQWHINTAVGWYSSNKKGRFWSDPGKTFILLWGVLIWCVFWDNLEAFVPLLPPENKLQSLIFKYFWSLNAINKVKGRQKLLKFYL